MISVHPKVISTGYFTDNTQWCSWMSSSLLLSSSAWGLIMIDKQSIISLLKSFTRVRCDTSTRVQIHAETHTNKWEVSMEMWEILPTLLTQARRTKEMKWVWICHTVTDSTSGKLSWAVANLLHTLLNILNEYSYLQGSCRGHASAGRHGFRGPTAY